MFLFGNDTRKWCGLSRGQLRNKEPFLAGRGRLTEEGPLRRVKNITRCLDVIVRIIFLLAIKEWISGRGDCVEL